MDLDIISKGNLYVNADHAYNKQRFGQFLNNHHRVFKINPASCSNSTNVVFQPYINTNCKVTPARLPANPRYFNLNSMSAYNECRTNPVHVSNPSLNTRDSKIKKDNTQRSNPSLNEIKPEYGFAQRRQSFRNEAYITKRATSWCCGSFVKKQLKKTKHYD